MGSSYFKSFELSFLISGLTCSNGFTLTEGLKDELLEAKEETESRLGEPLPEPLLEPPNFAITFGVLGPGDRIGTTVEPGVVGILNGFGRGFGDGGTRLDVVFFRVSVIAAKLSALDNEPGCVVYAPPGLSSEEAVERPLVESDDGDRDFDRLGRGAGTGGLLANGPAGRSITRSGVCPGVFVFTVVFCSQKFLFPLKLLRVSLLPSSADGLLVVLFSHISLFLANIETFSTLSCSRGPFLLAQLFCFSSTPSGSAVVLILTVRGVTAGGVCPDLGRAPVSGLFCLNSNPSLDS